MEDKLHQTWQFLKVTDTHTHNTWTTNNLSSKLKNKNWKTKNTHFGL